MILSLSAKERRYLRGRRQTLCGQEVLLHLPREGPLMEGDVLAGENRFPKVVVRAAVEDLLVVRTNSLLELIKASYHLGNRHVELELHSQELFLLDDTVLAKMLRGRGLKVEKISKPFFPELGAYSQVHRQA
ncbi:urease accessory protein UreE [Prochlorococcus sp. MIT 1307]|uniref:urease accessory protein UreE n=1 Tax=Prochlorococcus sp. MIT 1307 TaxID=3096219 RepID=UPI002A75F6AA|nr:urease accessory protein UreE [Prochlorococcus sp. MIT 1307]